jgi:nucleoside-diphosphate-sugar epimerase
MVQDGVSVRAATHRHLTRLPTGIEVVHGIDLSGESDWGHTLSGCDAIVHTGARVHVFKDSATDPLAEFRRVNVSGTLALARQAAEAGVRRFVFLSSIKVNGEITHAGGPFTAEDVPAPEDAYGLSKYEAEVALRALAATTGMEVVIIRPVLVYGPGVKANFLAMMRWIARGLPLPFGAVENQRSLVGLENLVDLVAVCVRHPNARNQTFLVSDGEDLSTRQLLQRTAAALGRRTRLLSIPQQLLEAGATLLGKRKIARRLLGSLQIDMGKTRKLLDWTPPLSIDQQLRSTADWYLGRDMTLAG